MREFVALICKQSSLTFSVSVHPLIGLFSVFLACPRSQEPKTFHSHNACYYWEYLLHDDSGDLVKKNKINIFY